MKKLKRIEDFVENGRFNVERFVKEKEDFMSYGFCMVITNPDYDEETDVVALANENGHDYILELMCGGTNIFHWTDNADDIINNGFKLNDNISTSFGPGLYFFNFNPVDLPYGENRELIVGDYDGVYFRCVMALADGSEEFYCYLPFNVEDVKWERYNPNKFRPTIVGTNLLTTVFNYEFEATEKNILDVIRLQSEVKNKEVISEEEQEKLKDTAFNIYSNLAGKTLSHEVVAFADIFTLYNQLTQENFQEFLARSVSLWIAVEEDCPEDFAQSLRDLLFFCIQDVLQHINVYNFVPVELLYLAYTVGEVDENLDSNVDGIKDTHKLNQPKK